MFSFCARKKIEVGETQEDLDNASLFFSFFAYYVQVIKLIFCPKKETHYAYGQPYVFLIFYAEESHGFRKKNQICPMLLGGFGQAIWGGYEQCPNPPQMSNSSLKSIQILPEFSVQMHPTA